MKLKTLPLFAAICAAAATLPASALPLVYDEAVHGDLRDGNLQAMAVDAGLNTVKGSLTIISDQVGGGQLDLDPFMFSVPQGMTLTGVSVALSFDDSTANTDIFKAYWQLADGQFSQVWNSCFLQAGSAQDCTGPASGGALGGGFPLAAGNFFVGQGSYHLWHDQNLPSGGTISYLVSLQVSAVPEPGAVALLALGVALLTSSTRRRSSTPR